MTERGMPQSGISPGLSSAPICSQRPEAREVIYKLIAIQHLGHFSPSEVLSEPPPMLATVFSRSSYGWTGVVISPIQSWPYRVLPDIENCRLSLALFGGVLARLLSRLLGLGTC